MAITLVGLMIAGSISAADCQKDMAFAITLKENGYVCLSNGGSLYVKPGTNLDAAASSFLRTLSETARKLDQSDSIRKPMERAGT